MIYGLTSTRSLSQDSIRLKLSQVDYRAWRYIHAGRGIIGVKPLYCFILDDNYELKRYVIEEYKHDTNYTAFYTIEIDGSIYHIKSYNLDLFRRGKYVSFTDDIEAARKAMISEYLKKLEKAEAECKRFADILDIIKGEK